MTMMLVIQEQTFETEKEVYSLDPFTMKNSYSWVHSCGCGSRGRAAEMWRGNSPNCPNICSWVLENIFQFFQE